jgi:hypothetical protein
MQAQELASAITQRPEGHASGRCSMRGPFAWPQQAAADLESGISRESASGACCDSPLAGVIRQQVSAMLSGMPSRTDDPPRPQRQRPTAGLPASASSISPASSPALPSADEAPLTQESFRAILSSHQRAGRWQPADDIEVRAILGEVTLDFRRAELPESGVIEIEALAICGDVTILVPDGADVELEGTPVIGSIEQQAHKQGHAKRATQWIREFVTGERDEDLPIPQSSHDEEPPFFRIEARAFLGNVKVIGR